MPPATVQDYRRELDIANAEYYALNSAIGFLATITLPTLIIHAMDDPMIPAAPYRTVDWDAFPTVTREITAHGGHVGFHGRGSRLPWYVGRVTHIPRHPLRSTRPLRQ